MADLSQAMSLAASPVLVGAAFTDVASRRVPNACCVMVAGFGIAARIASGDLPPSLMLAVVVFGVLFVFWSRHWLGGGDVKLLAACALLVPANAVAEMALVVALFGGLLAAAYLAARMAQFRPAFIPHPAGPHGILRRLWRIEGWRIRRGAPLPYACAIAAGCIFTIVAG